MDIRTSYIYPPIPVRKFDWCAVDADTYDVDFIGGENDEWRHGPVGYGETEAEAIQDLLEQLEEYGKF